MPNELFLSVTVSVPGRNYKALAGLYVLGLEFWV